MGRTLNLDLKVPRVRIGNSFRPAILPHVWKHIDKDYEADLKLRNVTLTAYFLKYFRTSA